MATQLQYETTCEATAVFSVSTSEKNADHRVDERLFTAIVNKAELQYNSHHMLEAYFRLLKLH